MRIRPLPVENAVGTTKEVFGRIQKSLGTVPNLYRTIGHSAGSLASVLSWDQAVVSGNLSKRDVELINLHVSELNGCGYCLSAHTLVSKGAGLTTQEIRDARSGHSLQPRENALLAFVRKIIRTGGSGANAEVERLFEHGFTEADIVNILATVALKQFTNSLAIVAGTEIDFPKAENLPEG